MAEYYFNYYFNYPILIPFPVKRKLISNEESDVRIKEMSELRNTRETNPRAKIRRINRWRDRCKFGVRSRWTLYRASSRALVFQIPAHFIYGLTNTTKVAAAAARDQH